MSTRPPSIFSTALREIEYRLALGVIGFGVYFGTLLACLIPFGVFEAYFDTGGTPSVLSAWVTGAYFICVPLAVLYRFRGWIIKQAVIGTAPKPVDETMVPLSAREKAGEVAGALWELVAGLASLLLGLIALAVLAVLAYGGYLLLTMLTISMAILVGAIIIALAVLALASR